MKTLMVIGEKLAGVLVWIPTILILPIGLLITTRQAPRYIRSRRM